MQTVIPVGENCAWSFVLTVLFCYTEKNSFLCDSNIHTINCQFLWLKGEENREIKRILHTERAYPVSDSGTVSVLE